MRKKINNVLQHHKGKEIMFICTVCKETEYVDVSFSGIPDGIEAIRERSDVIMGLRAAFHAKHNTENHRLEAFKPSEPGKYAGLRGKYYQPS